MLRNSTSGQLYVMYILLEFFKKEKKLGFLGGSVIKNLPANVGDAGSIPESGKPPGEGNGNPLQESCLGNPTDRSLAGHSPWGYRVRL